MPGATPTKLYAPPRLGKGADPSVTPDLKGGAPTSNRGRDPFLQHLQILLPALGCLPHPALNPLLPPQWASHRHKSGTSRF